MGGAIISVYVSELYGRRCRLFPVVAPEPRQKNFRSLTAFVPKQTNGNIFLLHRPTRATTKPTIYVLFSRVGYTPPIRAVQAILKHENYANKVLLLFYLSPQYSNKRSESCIQANNSQDVEQLRTIPRNRFGSPNSWEGDRSNSGPRRRTARHATAKKAGSKSIKSILLTGWGQVDNTDDRQVGPLPPYLGMNACQLSSG